MKLGEKILASRKNKNMSQEQLASEVKVTRQTISNWELNETTPDANQLKALSKALEISVDVLLDNETSNIVVEKVSNVEKLAGIMITILKVIGVICVIALILQIVGFISFVSFKKDVTTSDVVNAQTTCQLNEQAYTISIDKDGNFDCLNCPKEMQEEIEVNIDYRDIDASIKMIEAYFEKKQGSCE